MAGGGRERPYRGGLGTKARSSAIWARSASLTAIASPHDDETNWLLFDAPGLVRNIQLQTLPGQYYNVF